MRNNFWMWGIFMEIDSQPLPLRPLFQPINLKVPLKPPVVPNMAG